MYETEVPPSFLIFLIFGQINCDSICDVSKQKKKKKTVLSVLKSFIFNIQTVR